MIPPFQQRNLSLNTANIKVIATATGTMKISRNTNPGELGGNTTGMYSTLQGLGGIP